MNEITYDIQSRRFGILSDRVRGVGVSHLKAKGSMDKAYEGKAKEYEERKAAIDENGWSSPTSKRVVEIEKGRYGDGYKLRKGEDPNKIREKEMYMEYVPNTYFLDKKIKGTLKETKRTDEEKERDNKGNAEYKNPNLVKQILSNRPDIRRIRYGVKYKDAVKKHGEYGAFAEQIPSQPARLYLGKKVKDNPMAILHEMVHFEQPMTSGSRHAVLGEDYNEKIGRNVFRHKGADSYHDVEHIFDYINYRNKHEHEANYKAHRRLYLIGEDNEGLNKGYETGERSNKAYDWRLLGYRPQNIDWNMDAEALFNLRRNLQKQKI